MAEKLDEIWKTQKIQMSRLEAYKSEMTTLMTQHANSNQEELYRRLDGFKVAFISASRGLGNRLNNVELKMINGVLSPNNGATIPPSQRGNTKAMSFELEQTGDHWSSDAGNQA
jgi:hypothetical protein